MANETARVVRFDSVGGAEVLKLQKWHGLQAAGRPTCLMDPGDAEVPHGLGIDVVERTVVPGPGATVVGQPVVRIIVRVEEAGPSQRPGLTRAAAHPGSQVTPRSSPPTDLPFWMSSGFFMCGSVLLRSPGRQGSAAEVADVQINWPRSVAKRREQVEDRAGQSQRALRCFGQRRLFRIPSRASPAGPTVRRPSLAAAPHEPSQATWQCSPPSGLQPAHG